jgi:hypothetical protein
MKPKTISDTPAQINPRKLLWRHLRALNELYENRRTGAQVLDNAYVEHLRSDEGLIMYKPGNRNVVVPRKRYDTYYELHHKSNFSQYMSFLKAANLPDEGTRVYTESDLLSLMLIYRDKEVFTQSLTTVNQFSAKVFRSAKYLDDHRSVYAAVCKLLDIERFPDQDPKDHQWRLVVDCLHPHAIVLCENLDYLKLPWKAREHNIELWYVGGNNIGIIEFIADEKLTLPLYYSCDWDYAGLQIYSRVRAKMRAKSKDVSLLLPHDISYAEHVDTPPHKSRWEGAPPLSNLNEEDFNAEHQKLIRYLVQEDLWIEEETQDLIEVLRSNGVFVTKGTGD